MQDPGQGIDPFILSLIAKAMAPKTKSGSNLTQADIDPYQQLIMSMIAGQSPTTPVDEDAIRQANAPQWTAMANFQEYAEDDVEPKILHWIAAGLPLSQVYKKIAEELKAQGKPSKSKDENVKQLNNLAETLFKEYSGANAEIQKARTKSLENSPYTKLGISDPSDYPVASAENIPQLYPEQFTELLNDPKYKPIAKGPKPQDRELLPGEKRQGFWNQQETPLQKIVGTPLSLIHPGVFAGAALIDTIERFRNMGKVYKDGKEVKAEEYKPETTADKQWIALQRSLQNLNPIPEQKKVPLGPDPRTHADINRYNTATADYVRRINERRANTPTNLDTEGTRKLNEFRAAQQSADLAGVAEIMQRATNKKLQQTAQDTTSKQILQKIILMKAMDNPKLFANPEIQKILGG